MNILFLLSRIKTSKQIVFVNINLQKILKGANSFGRKLFFGEVEGASSFSSR